MYIVSEATLFIVGIILVYKYATTIRLLKPFADMYYVVAIPLILATGLSNVFGIMSICCCLFVCVLVTNKHIVTRIGVALYTLMESISGIGYAIFPLSSKGYDGSFHSLMHVYVITSAVVALSIILLILISIGSFKDKRKTLGVLAIVALVLMFVGTVGAGAAPKAVFGIFERFSTYSAVVFTAILGVFHSIEK